METTPELNKTDFSEVLEQLTDENQQEILGVLEALYFAQNTEDNTA